MAVKTKEEKRKRRHLRVRKKVIGTPERPRLCVFRSLKHIYAQIIDDMSQKTLVSASTLEPSFRETGKSGGNVEAASIVGKIIAKRALEKGIKKVVFDRGGYLYHGRVKALADGAREGGLDF
ncbi:MAG: 50S ribosomal protein L18 [Candidatus Fermentithermobacillus carboniphilus]|uniref:Large ribosomal subunit protein uL18 n=1 Tax=Candidatus Fermentithermobacillus carboniphilus TaxID=3085328 RepID=A0AAT9LAB3_9FIRM|nr:MAG: 50S ribosomal protein L18 [Candidatus Fermentithermobacillus carboniphilus]